ncbi:MAG: hypothetical protein ACRCV9_04925 [Burkholderiaceae bacterium]
MPDLNPNQVRFEALAPLYAAGTLNAADRAWMDAYIKSEPKAANDLKWHVGMTQQLHARFDDVPTNIGLDKALAQVQMLPKRQPVQTAAQAAPLKRLIDWFFAGSPKFSPAFAVLLLCALAPSLLLMQKSEVPHSETRSVKQGLFDGPLLRVNFKADAKESEMRFLLLEQGGLVVGPTRLGDWFVRVAPGRIEAVREALSKSALVASVEIVQTLPAELVDQ